MAKPSIAVVMAAYNAENTIRESINSVLASTVPVTLFIIDDASATPLTQILINLPNTIIILRNDTNLGPAAARNRGIQAAMTANYTYIAVQDADDISSPNRFIKQAEYLTIHPNCGMVGTWGHAVDEHTQAILYTIRVSTCPTQLHNNLWLDCNFVAASVMFRASALKETGLYEARLRNCEDYELFFRIAKKYELGNIPEPLLSFRLRAQGISQATLRRQRRYRLIVQWLHFRPTYWQSWVGITKSLIRIATPTSVVETAKKRLGIQRFF